MQIIGQKKIDVINKTKGRCAYCGCKITDDNFTIDHIRPKAKGGRNNIDNLFLCCKKCNQDKKDIPLEKFRMILTFKKNNIPIFSAKQIEYLKKKQVYDLCIPEKIKFYFENKTD